MRPQVLPEDRVEFRRRGRWVCGGSGGAPHARPGVGARGGAGARGAEAGARPGAAREEPRGRVGAARRGGGGEETRGGARGPGPAGRRRPCTRSRGRHRRSQLGPKFPAAAERSAQPAARAPRRARPPPLGRCPRPASAHRLGPGAAREPSGQGARAPRGRPADPRGRADTRRDQSAARRVGAPGRPGPAGARRAGPGGERAGARGPDKPRTRR